MPNWKKVIVSGSDASLNSLFVLTSVTGSSFRGSFTGSLFGTSSWAENVVTASYALFSGTASYALNAGQAVLVTGSNAILNQSIPALTWSFDHNLNNQYPVFQVFNSANEVVIPEKIVAVSTTNALIYFSTETSGTAVADIGGYTGSQASISASYAETASYALTASYVLGSVSGFPYTGSARITGSLDVVGPITATNITSSLFGTASWAENALTASYAINIVVSGSIEDVDYINFDTSSAFTNLAGRLGWDSGEGTLQLGLAGGNVQLSVGTQLYQYVYNSETSSLSKGQIVFISGSQGNRIAVKLADNSSDRFSAGTLGFVAETITAGGTGWIITEGPLRKLNTLGLTGGSLLFLGETPGTYTETKPVAPRHEVRVGYVERVNATVGSIYVKIDNGYEIGELHDVVDTTTTSSYGDLLIKSGSIWINSNSLTGSYSLTGSLNATSFTGSLFGTASIANSAISASYVSGSAAIVTNLTSSNDAKINQLTIGHGGGNITSNTVLGSGSFISNSTGDINVAIGAETLKFNDTGQENVAIGYQALYSNTTGRGNIMHGAYAMYANTNGFANIGLGTEAFYTSSGGSDNIGLGRTALYNNSGNDNVAIGRYVMFENTTGNYNVAIGARTFENNRIGQFNAALGANSLQYSISGSYNVGLGAVTMGSLTNGEYNTAVGAYAGGGITSGSYNTIIGAQVSGLASNLANNIILADGQGNIKYRWDTVQNNIYGNLAVTGSVRATTGFTGSLFGTASWATNFLTSSVTSASYAFTASSAVSAYTASSAISSSLSISSSYAFTASSAVSAFTASSAVSASRAITASFALTASSADNFLVRQTLTASAALISGSGTQRLTVVGSGSAQPLFTVLGSQGELFSITDNLSGSLFSVNDISGLPIFEVFSDSTTLMGNYSAPMLITTFRTGSVSVGANTIYALPTASYDGVFVDYTIKSGSNARAGNFSAIWTGTAVNFMDNSTVDFGNTSGFVLGAQITGGNLVVTGSATTTGWTVKTIIRSI